MALRDEQADILGGPILQRPESGVFASLTQYLLAFKSVALLLVGLLVWIACVRGLEHLKKHRELRYRKAMRRKHGIPDSDCRPFAVAYAAAKRAHVEREAQDRKKTTNYVSDHSLPAVGQRTDARKDARGLRRRVPETTIERHGYQPSARHASAYDSKCLEPNPLNFADRYNPNSRHRVVVRKPSPAEWLPVRHPSRKALVINLDDSEESRKRSFEDESDVEHETLKKSRIDGDEVIDGDEQPDWYAQYSDEPLEPAPKEFSEQDHYSNNQEQYSERPDDEREVIDEAMEDIDEGEVEKLKAVARGKKRDRAEAGSTFGGDEDEDIRNGRVSHHRKRRTVLRRTIEVPTRGQKRDREAESPESGGEGGGSETSRRHAHRSSKKKRGKRAVVDGSEIPAEDHRVSKDPLCGGRKVGDEWEDDGIQYRVGEKGERLRLTLVKKAKNKYHMPQDSQHPDRSAALEIYVETWMTEEHYKQAEGRQELAWQEVPKESNGSKTADVFDPSTKSGKDLLWDSVRGSPARPPLRQVMSASALTRINPFEQLQLQPSIGRRVASSSTIISPILLGVADSPTRPGFRGFSKWEKQDREAEAMARIRAKAEEEKKVQPPPQKGTELKSITAPELTTKPISVPTITLTPAPTMAEGGLEDSTQQSKVNAPILSSMPVTSSDSVKSNTVAGPALSFTSTPPASSSTLFPSVPAAPTATSSSTSLSPFSFAKPPQLPSSTLPNFEKGSSTATPPSTTLLPSALGATTSSTGIVSKPAAFSFAKADTSSAAVPPTVKHQASIFGGNSGPSPSSAIFGSTPTAAKAESSHPPTLTSTASESMKPTAPLFSFSGTSAPSPSTTTHPSSSAPSVPKFLFGQPSAAPVHTPSSGLAPGTTSQVKPTFNFGQASPSAVDTSTVRAADESKKSALPVSAFGATASLNELVRPPSSGTASAFGGSSITSPSPATNLFGKLVTGNSETLTSTPPKPTPAPAPTVTLDNNAFPPAPASSNTPVLPFGISSGAKSAEASKPTSLFGEIAGNSNPMSMFSGNPAESKPTFAFGASAQGSKPSLFSGNTENIKSPPVFGGSTEGPKLAFPFGGSAETSKTASAFGGFVEGSKSTFAFSNATTSKSMSELATKSEKPASLSTTSDTTKLLNIADTFTPTSSPGSAIFGSSSVSPFIFSKDDVTTNSSTSDTQSKPSFPFGTPSSTTDLTFGQPSVFATSGDSGQATFGKPSNATPSGFTFGTGVSSSSATFSFGKPASKNQKQEQ